MKLNEVLILIGSDTVIYYSSSGFRPSPPIQI